MLIIILSKYQSAADAAFWGILQGVVFTLFFVVRARLKNARKKRLQNKVEWDEVSKDESDRVANENGSDWDSIKKNNNKDNV